MTRTVCIAYMWWTDTLHTSTLGIAIGPTTIERVIKLLNSFRVEGLYLHMRSVTSCWDPAQNLYGTRLTCVMRMSICNHSTPFQCTLRMCPFTRGAFTHSGYNTCVGKNDAALSPNTAGQNSDVTHTHPIGQYNIFDSVLISLTRLNDGVLGIDVLKLLCHCTGAWSLTSCT